MNICIFTDCYLPVKNGVVTSIVQTEKVLRSKGHNVIIITAGVPGFKYADNVFAFRSVPVINKILIRHAFINMSKVVSILKENRIDIIHIHTEFAAGIAGKKAARILKLPALYTAHTLYSHYKHYVLLEWIKSEYFIKRLYKRFMKDMNLIIAPSVKMKNYLENIDGNKKFIVLNNCIDEEYLRRTIRENDIKLLLKKYHIIDADRLVIFIGRISGEKKIFELSGKVYDVIKDLDNVKFIAIGGGVQLRKYRRSVKNKRDKIIAAGYLEWKDAVSLLSRSSVFVTISDSEVNPMTVLESVHCGIPVICKNDGSAENMIVNNENGFLIDDDSEFKEKLAMLLSDNELHAKMASSHVKKTMLSGDSIDELIKLYRSAVPEKY